MYAGFCNASGDLVAVMDADMQDPPSLLPKMLELIESGEYDSVATRRVNRKGEPKIRSFFARMFYKLMGRISDADIVDGARDFRLMKRKMVDAIVSMGETNRFSKGIFGWVGFRTYYISYENRERAVGTTKWNFWNLVNYAIEGIIGYSTAPLRLATVLGTMTGISAVLYLIWVIIEKLVWGIAVPGYATIIVLTLLLGAIQLFCIGIIGEYVGRTFEQSKDRPIYIAKEVLTYEET
jgi:glycosyltransferase involved in cell wall biosynthesis